MAGRALTPEQVAEMWGCSPTLVKDLIKRGHLRAFKVAARMWRIPQEAMQEYQDTYGAVVEPDRSHHRVYFIACGQFVKIGVAGDVQARLKGLQTASAETLALLGSVPGSFAEEKEFHARFREHHHRDEWFRSEGALREFVEGLRDA